MLPTKVDVLVCAQCGHPVHARTAAARGTAPCQCAGERKLTTQKMLSSVFKGAGTLLRAKVNDQPLLIWS